MTLPYESAKGGNAAFGEIQRLLDKFGADNFGVQQRNTDGVTLIAFEYRGVPVQIEVSWRDYADRYLEKNPYHNRRQSTSAEWTERALDHAKRVAPSILRDYVKAQLTLVECGSLSFEEVFFAQLVAPDGRRVIDLARNNLKLLEFKK